MTKREFYTAITENETLTAEMREFAQTLIDGLDKTLEKRKNKPTKAAVENAPLVEKVIGALTDEVQTATDLMKVFNGELKVQKVSTLLRAAVAQGKANVQDVKIKGKGTQKGYTRVVSE